MLILPLNGKIISNFHVLSFICICVCVLYMCMVHVCVVYAHICV